MKIQTVKKIYCSAYTEPYATKFVQSSKFITMKKITYYLLPRYIWFLTWFKQWFKNPEGIKGFADQVLNLLLQATLKIASRLKKQNKRLSEKIREKTALLEKRYQHPIIEADEFDDIRSGIRKLGFWITIGIIAESALNYFAITSVITAKGWIWFPLKAILALAITGLSVYLFKKWFAVIINKPKYKQDDVKPRSLIDLVVLTLLCIAYELGFYYLCKIRGVALEGNHGDSIITNFVIITGMLLPLVAGYLAYERSLYFSPYRNTLCIAKLERQVAKMENTIAINNQKMETHFKKELEDKWAMLQEFKIYKGNFNIKHDFPHESITGHFCETYERFISEAIKRYKERAIHDEPLKPALIITEEQSNGQIKELKPSITN